MTRNNKKKGHARKEKIHFRVVGLQRSGNHAVTSWLMAQFPGRSKLFLNNVGHGAADPVDSAAAIETERGPLPWEAIDTIHRAEPSIIIVSFEDDERKIEPGHSFVDSVFSRDRQEQLARRFGRPHESFEVLVLRDPYNFFASRIRKLHELPGIKDLYEIRRNWKRLAQRCLATMDDPDGSRLFVNFGRWFSEEDYRRELSAHIGGTFSDASLQRVSSHGGGSSFDGTDYGARLDWDVIKDNWRKLLEPSRYLRLAAYVRRLFAPGAQSMKVLERWRRMQQDEQYLEIIDDDEMRALSDSIFGRLPGTESLHGRSAMTHGSG